MNLFSDTEIFSTGTIGRKVFDGNDLDVLLIDNFFSKTEADNYYNILSKRTQWREYEMPMYDKKVMAPRMISWYEKADFTKELKQIHAKVEKETNIQFNAVLLNLYRNGNDGVSWHSDKTNGSNKNLNIASVTFGETRIFRLRHKFNKNIPKIEIPLHHGAFLLMAGQTNSNWEHEVPKTKREILPRINLTFRQIISNY